MAPKNKGNGTVERVVRIKRGGEVTQDSYDVFEEDEDTIQAIRNPAYVEVSAFLTHNLGDGDFIKVGIGITLPSRTNRRSLKNTTIRAKRFVRERIEGEFSAAKKQIQSL